MKQSTTLEVREQAQSIEHRLEPLGSAEFLLATIDLLSRHRRALVRLTVSAFVVFTAVAFLIPKRYEAVARLMPPDQSSAGAAMLGALTAKGGDILGAMAGEALGLRTSGAAVVGILTSRTVQDDLINQFDLRKVYWRKRYEDTRKILEKRTRIGEDKKSGIITITVQDSSPQRAADIARAYIDDLNRRVSQLTTSSAHRERIFLEERLKSVKTDLDRSTLQLSRFSSKTMTFDPQIQGKAMLEAAETLQGQLIAAESELSGLEQIYGPENSRVKAVAARAGELSAKLRSLRGEGTPGGSSPGQIGPSIEQLPLLGNTYYDLARQAKINEAVYEALTKQYELAKVQEAKEIPSIKVLDEPVVPERKVWPPRLLIIVLGTVMTFLLDVLFLYSKQRAQQLAVDDSRRVLLDRLLGCGRLRD
jgi:capsule polysaccharide export protein KpsE/RkpR